MVCRASGAPPVTIPFLNQLLFIPFLIQSGFLVYRPFHSSKFPSSNPPLSQCVCPARLPLSLWCGHRAQ
eukprot:2636616-Rhodomonas_salina.1